jgi:4-hydroxy-4-methyl-2-oxoglutarate aldolase
MSEDINQELNNMRIRWFPQSSASLLACAVLATLAPEPASAQLWSWTKDQMTEYTKAWTGDRFPDGRPKIPDSMLQRARELSMEEITVPGAGGRGGGGGGYSQYSDGWMVLQPGKKMVGRAFTVQFMPARADLDAVSSAKAKEKGVPNLNNQHAIDMLQPGDVLVVDLFGKKEGGTMVGDNLFYYVMKATKNGGLVVDGSVRDLEGIAEMPMPAYVRSVHPSAISGATLSGINVPIRIGNVTVMPGDLVVGDREGISFIPPQAVAEILDRADTTHVHDEWTRKKFDEGKYKSSEIYGSPKDPALKQEYNEYLKKRLEEIRKK